MGPISGSSSSTALGGEFSGNWDNSGFVVNYKSPKDNTLIYLGLAAAAVIGLILWKR